MLRLRLSRTVWTQLAILGAVTVIACSVMAFGFVHVPALLGFGRYTVTVDLPESGGLYPTSVVTYRGTEVGRVKAVDVTPSGVRAVLNLDSSITVPADVSASVHSRSAVGEQFIELRPTAAASDSGRTLRDGASIPVAKVQIPPDIGNLLDATNRSRPSPRRIYGPSSTRRTRRSAGWGLSCPASSTGPRRWPPRPARTSARSRI